MMTISIMAEHYDAECQNYNVWRGVC